MKESKKFLEELFFKIENDYRNDNTDFIDKISTLIFGLIKVYLLYKPLNYNLSYDQFKKELDAFYKSNNNKKVINNILDLKEQYSGSNHSYSINKTNDWKQIFYPVNILIADIQEKVNEQISIKFDETRLKNPAIKQFDDLSIERYKEQQHKKIPLKNNELYIDSQYYLSNEVLVIENFKYNKKIQDDWILKSIYNLLIRNSIVKKSDYLENQNLSISQYKLIYIFQIMSLLFLISCKKEEEKVFCCCEEFSDLLKKAVFDLEMYYEKFNSLSRKPNDSPFNKIRYVFKGSFEGPRLHFTNSDLTYRVEKSAQVNDKFKNLYILTSSNVSIHVTEDNKMNWDFFAKTYFGVNVLKIGQIDMITECCEYHHNNEIPCCILPTGYGKSMIYQLISFIIPKISFVIVATDILVEDQLYNLNKENKNFMASDIFSLYDIQYYSNDVNDDAKYEVAHCFSRALLVYTVPIQFYVKDSIELLNSCIANNHFNLLTIDEIHQASLWSHKYDVDYLVLCYCINNMTSNIKMLFTTATATNRVKNDLNQKYSKYTIRYLKAERLKRQSITHKVIEANDFDEIVDDIVLRFDENFNQGTAFDLGEGGLVLIINNDIDVLEKIYRNFCKHKKYSLLCDLYNGSNIDAYERFRVGNTQILFATDDFSIGINIPEIKVVITICEPMSKEWYYQETGRVSRNDSDGYSVIYLLKDQNKKAILLERRETEKIFDNYFLNKSKIAFPNLRKLFEVFLDVETEKENIKKLVEGIDEKRGKDSSLKIAFDKNNKNFYNNAFHIAFIMDLIKFWREIKGKEDKRTYQVELNDSPKNYLKTIKKSKEFINEYSVNDRITKMFFNNVELVTNEVEIFCEFSKWYFSTIVYQNFENITNILNMFHNKIGDGYSDVIEEELEYVFLSKETIDILQQGQGNYKKNNYSVIEKIIDIDDSIQKMQIDDSIQKMLMNKASEEEGNRIFNMLIKNSGFMNLGNELKHKNLVEGLLSDRFDLLYVKILAFYELKEGDIGNRMYQILGELNNYDFYEFFQSVEQRISNVKKILNSNIEYVLKMYEKYGYNELIKKKYIEEHDQCYYMVTMLELIEEYKME